ncbi:vitamin K epoxide reductase family protein [Muricauda oceani]|uniref:Vitamin K epoxide reductase family protein n=1 Tax=Flagellimonas oceani TaxID=2698672 RepID=A0A6G7J8J2_9FLAO|nr:vitamin K epoxide reductase family protein [Allomuricauda oceani]MBW8241826.1 vitamin K epoxide reductase family protein [Allomuricauda oceani]QII46747.1 vitamin K epoxide reductase family protein [Allomuricauda oceani]
MQKTTEHIPPGWDYNPATWSQRIPIVVLALIGFGIATYLSLYQLDYIDTVWEPFFGDGSVTILNSKISHVLPIPDAALGAFGYLVDAVAGVIGGTARWRKMPWIVIVFGLAVGPLGFVSVMLVVFQPVLFSAWCSLCLASAIISIAMIGPAMDEMLASLQYIQRAKKSGASTWKVFWGIRTEVEKVK